MMIRGHEDFSRAHEFKAASNRAFGWVFVTVFAIIGAFPLLFGQDVHWWSVLVAVVLSLITLLAPALLALPNRLWLRFGLLINRIISPIVLVILFFVLVTPMGLLARAFGKDTLRLRRGEPQVSSYWIKRDPPGPKPDSMDHQF